MLATFGIPGRRAAVFALSALSMCGLPATAARAQDLKTPLKDFFVPLGSPTAGSVLATLASVEVSTAPLGTSTGGFTFTFDPVLRAWTRSASSFGPSFAERSLTTGRLKVSAGFNFLHAGYNSLGGQDLQNGDFRSGTNIRNYPGYPTLSYASAKLNVSSNTLVTFGHVGITDDLDVGVAIPWTSVTTSGTGAFYTTSGSVLQTAALAENSASGVGDVALFGKYRFWRQEGGGLAAAVEMRLPTGDKAGLRGLGVTRTLVSGIWSKSGTISPHVNVGYELWSADVPLYADGSVAAKNQFKYAAGVEIEAHPRMTLVVDLVGQNVLHGGRIGYQTFTQGASSADLLVALPESVHAVSLAPAVKWNVWRSVLLTGNVLVSLSNNGLRANTIPVIGLDWAF